jgi:phenylpyruvate tautomerase PptA (4-oxalocrotonate tautomerase family)/ketosteroid isomerase-like protein
MGESAEMPMIECSLIEGYDRQTRNLIAERLTDAACATIGAHPDFVIVTIKEISAENYMRGRVNRMPAKAPQQPEVIVRAFLDAMEQRDLDKANSFISETFEMVFPGNHRFHQLHELVAWAKTRYQSIAKTYDGFDTAFHGTEACVTCFGTLRGIWPDGTPFDNIRFIDRFTLRDGSITSQQVWNDLAETTR